MKLLLALLIIFSTNYVIFCQKNVEVKAYINKQNGDGFFRQSKNGQETPLTGKKKVGTKLYPDEEIRCGKNCTIELLMCTKSKESVTEADGWYRIPNIVCSEEFIPGYKKTFRPGGRLSNFNLNVIEEDFAKIFPTRKQSLSNVVNLNMMDNQTNSGFTFNEFFELIPPGSILAPKYSYKWRFRYPYQGALIIPQFFTFEIAKSNFITENLKLHLFITIAAYENNNSIKIYKEWKKELFLQNDLLVNAKGENFNPHETQSFLDEAREYYGKLPARMFCTVTVAEVDPSTNLDTKPNTFGFEFNVMTAADEKIILKQLELSTKATGFAHYIGRAEIFESLGLIKLAINEYSKGLKDFPENEYISDKVSILQGVTFY